MGQFRDIFEDFIGKTYRILLYHSISNESRYAYSVSPEEFAWQMEWLHKNKIKVLSLQEAVSERPGSGLGVVITFDDGYEDNFTVAAPILEKYGYKATIFLATGFVGGWNSWEEEGSFRLNLMNWEQVQILIDKGFIMGGHTHGHINLLKTAQAAGDLKKSTQILREKIKQDFIPFAYPFGKYNDETIDIISGLKYDCALTAGGFWGNNERVTKWELRREDIHSGVSRKDFIAKVRGARDPRYFKLGFDYMLKERKV